MINQMKPAASSIAIFTWFIRDISEYVVNIKHCIKSIEGEAGRSERYRRARGAGPVGNQ
jgi:hypothetical protein